MSKRAWGVQIATRGPAKRWRWVRPAGRPSGRLTRAQAERIRNRLVAKGRRARVHLHKKYRKRVSYPTSTHFSKNFTRAEFASRGTPVPGNLAQNATELAAALEKLRDDLGVPIALLSVYRTPSHNADVGGASQSRHMQAEAADLNVPQILSAWSKKSGRARTRGELISAIRRINAFHGIGIYPSGGIHADVRPGSRVEWNDWNR